MKEKEDVSENERMRGCARVKVRVRVGVKDEEKENVTENERMRACARVKVSV
jgi:hypothetical protein